LLFIVYKLIPGSFGGGDIKLFFTSGAFLGLGNILVAFILSLIFCLIYIIIKRSKKNTQIAFGPYISLGVFISSIWGSVIILNYLQLFVR
jgi:leader peptidase (prepilin peptidase)/N-methyltransferase